MAKAPEERYSTAQALIADLEQLVRKPSKGLLRLVPAPIIKIATPPKIQLPNLILRKSRKISPKDEMTMVYIPAGQFLMGSRPSDPDAWDEEKPQHLVYLDAFWIDLTPISNAMFARFVAETSYQTDAEREGKSFIFDPTENNYSRQWVDGADWQHPYGPNSNLEGLSDHPVVQISWNDAQAYCKWAGRRLASEAEWEKAARGSDGRLYPWGNKKVAGNLLNFADCNLKVPWANQTINDRYQFTSPVGSYPDGASPYGILDMAGNVWGMGGRLFRRQLLQKKPPLAIQVVH